MRTDLMGHLRTGLTSKIVNHNIQLVLANQEAG